MADDHADRENTSRPGGASGARNSATDRDRHPSSTTSPAPPRVAVYEGEGQPPQLFTLEPAPPEQTIEQLWERVTTAVRHQGGRIPSEAIREVLANLVHAGFADVVVTVSDFGNTVRVTDRGPGIPEKEKALRTGFTTAGREEKRYIRGVGAGLSLVRSWLGQLGGDLQLEDNLSGGTVVSLTVPSVLPAPDSAEPSLKTPLTERQLQALLLVVELGPIGPTLLAKELGISGSTAYRELLALDLAGLATSDKAGRRIVTERGLGYLEQVL